MPDLLKPFMLRADQRFIYISDDYGIKIYSTDTFALQRKIGKHGKGPGAKKETGNKKNKPYTGSFSGQKPGNNMETWEVMMNYAMNYKIVIFDDFFNRLDPDKVNEVKMRLAEKVIYSITLTSDYYLAENFIDGCDQLHYLAGEKVVYSFNLSI